MFPSPKRAEAEVMNKQGVMPSNQSLPYPIYSHFAPQRLFVGFSPKDPSVTQSSISPTSTLETKQFSHMDKNQRFSPPVGLGLVDALHNESSRMVHFGSKLKIHVPLVRSNSIRINSKDSPSNFDAWPSPSAFSPDMQLSEDYTCVISHGPNPKTVHIFDNCVIESCDGDDFVVLRKENELSSGRWSDSSSDDFLSFCYACRKNLSKGKDIFMYRGEKAFCSEECRHREMLLDEGTENFSEEDL